MKKIKGYPCSKCKKLTDGEVRIFQYINDRITLVRFKKDCCKMKEVRLMTPYDIAHYIKEE